ncbi:MAG: hypothetical protein AAF599_07160 [Bacteroidota bacterium]
MARETVCCRPSPNPLFSKTIPTSGGGQQIFFERTFRKPPVRRWLAQLRCGTVHQANSQQRWADGVDGETILLVIFLFS